MKNSLSTKGFSLIEVVVGSSVCVIILLSLMGTFALQFKLAVANTSKIQAALLEEEGLEAARILRDNGWASNIATLATSTKFYITFDGTTWKATSTKQIIDSTFERSLMIQDVYRNGSKDIVTSGGTYDPDIKKITASVAWLQSGATTTKTLSTYLTNIFNN